MIKLSGVSKKFMIPTNKNSSLFLNFRAHVNRQANHTTIRALDDVTLEIDKGQTIGVIGANGSGKSTLLRIIAGIYLPTSGVVRTEAEVTPFVGLGAGLVPYLSVRDNIVFLGVVLGLKKAVIYRLLPEIVDFAGLSDYVGAEARILSLGMRSRLAFSIMMQAFKDIVLFDEMFWVGDEDFVDKCLRVVEGLKKEARTILLASHDMGFIEKFCDKTLLLDRGSVLAFGKSADVVARYKAMRRQ